MIYDLLTAQKQVLSTMQGKLTKTTDKHDGVVRENHRFQYDRYKHQKYLSEHVLEALSVLRTAEGQYLLL